MILIIKDLHGEMAERLKAPVLKTGKGAALSWFESQSLRH